MGPG
jgi:hypothetical protein